MRTLAQWCVGNSQDPVMEKGRETYLTQVVQSLARILQNWQERHCSLWASRDSQNTNRSTNVVTNSSISLLMAE